MTSRVLRLAKDLTLPLDFATKTAAILAQRRKGKTYTASVIAEEMVAVKQPFVALDPTGAWWGLRAGGDGTSQGLPVVVLGGQHGDVPLERTGGRLIADLVVEEPGYYVIDFSLFESGEAERQFAVDFAERLYRAKGQAGKDFPLHLFVDEADRFIPQQMRKGSGETSPRLLGAFEAIVRRGGLRGLGTTLISQRAAVVNKNVLEMLDVLMVLRTVGPNDQAAILGYIKAHGTDAERVEMMGSLASLEIGEAWIWEPGAEPPLFQRVHIRARHTFNSSATPKPGEKRVEPKRLADVDLATLQKRMAATIEKVKQDDPRELRRTIADLQRQLASKPAEKPAADTREADAMIKRLSDTVGQLQKTTHATVERELGQLHKHAEAQMFRWTAAEQKAREWLNTLLALRSVPAAAARPASSPKSPVPSPRGFVTRSTPVSERSKRPDPVKRPATGDDQALGRGQQKVLTAIAQHGEVGVTREQLTVLTGYKRSSRDTYLQQLLQRALIATNGNNTLVVTADGEAMLGPDFEALPTGDQLREHWLKHLPSGERRVLETVVAAYPDAIERDAISQATDYRRSSRDTYLQKLAARKLVVTDRGAVRASEELFS